LEQLGEARVALANSATPEENDSGYEQLMSTIGATIRSGTPEQKEIVLGILRQAYSPQSLSPKPVSATPAPLSHSTKVTPGKVTPTADLGSFATALKEHGDQIGQQPTYVYQKLSQIPSQVKCIVTFQDFTFEAVAPNRKVARHLAARDACKYLSVTD